IAAPPTDVGSREVEHIGRGLIEAGDRVVASHGDDGPRDDAPVSADVYNTLVLVTATRPRSPLNDRFLEAVLADSAIKLRSRQPETRRGPGLIAVSFLKDPRDRLAFDDSQIRRRRCGRGR